MTHLPPLCLTGARILTDGALQPGALSLADGLLTDQGGVAVDLSGYLVLPGIIDLHGDGFERHMAPRPTAPFPITAGLSSYAREAAASGVTTAYLAQGWSWEGGHRSPDHAEVMMEAVADFTRHALCDLRVQLRAETYLVDQADRLLAAAERFGLGYVVFNDHIEEAIKMRRMQPEMFGIWARKAGQTGQDLSRRIDAARAHARAVPRSLCHLAQGFERLGVITGSHDDPDAETRDFYAMMGARIAEFPTTRKAAAAARSMGDPVLMGAPNVVRGGSQSGNIAASALVSEGLCDALVSDYHLPALPLAAWTLVDDRLCGLAEAWAMISTNPARILRLSDRGRIAVGLRADLVIVNAQTRAIEATISAGRLAFMAGAVAGRFLGTGHGLGLAAE